MMDADKEPGGDGVATALIQAVYQVAIDPNAYDHLVELWGQYLIDVLKGEDLEKPALQPVSNEISDHLLRSFEILDRLGRVEQSQFVASSQRAELILNRAGQIIRCNEIAADVLGCAAGSSIFELALSPESGKRLRRSLATVQLLHPEDIYIFFDKHDELPYPMVRQAEPDETVSDRIFLTGLNQKWSDTHDRLLRSLFELTPAETRLARELLNGASLRQVAEATGRSVDTLRTQLKAIRRKTYTSSQQQLIRIMTGLETLVPVGSGSGSGAQGANTHHVLVTTDRRKLAYKVFGPDDGLSCLFIHNMLNGPTFSLRSIRQAHRLGLRLICPIRPAFGASDRDVVTLADPAKAPDRFAADVMHLLGHLGVTRVVVVGHMSGAVYAFRLAQLHPETVAAVLNVAGAVPMRELGQIASMNTRQKIMALTARFTPGMLPSLLRAGIAQIDAGGVEAFLNALYPKGTPDRHFAENEEYQSLLFEGFREIVEQGHWGFAIDAHHVVRNWQRYCSDIRQPVKLLHGAHDEVVSAHSVRAFSASMGFDCVVFPEAGQLVLLQETVKTFECLRDLAGSNLGS